MVWTREDTLANFLYLPGFLPPEVNSELQFPHKKRVGQETLLFSGLLHKGSSPCPVQLLQEGFLGTQETA